MLGRVERTALVVILGLIVELLFDHVLYSLLGDCLQLMQCIPGGCVGGEEAGVSLSSTLSASPMKTSEVENKAARQDRKRIAGIKTANKFRRKIQ